ncbi:MAG: hypothetical protein LBS36_10630 [Oscillospiraceae bacterium]|nr:hypothetical protein [Oscillospiraceae bacterium]
MIGVTAWFAKMFVKLAFILNTLGFIDLAQMLEDFLSSTTEATSETTSETVSGQ